MNINGGIKYKIQMKICQKKTDILSLFKVIDFLTCKNATEIIVTSACKPLASVCRKCQKLKKSIFLRMELGYF